MIAAWFVQASSSRMALGPIDLTIIVVYFVLVLKLGLYLKKFTNTGEDFFVARLQYERMDRRTQLHLGEPWLPGDDGLRAATYQYGISSRMPTGSQPSLRFFSSPW
jgi:hypothetical protein